MKQTSFTVTRAFVDSIEEDSATLLFGARRAQVPTSLLPDGVGEGSWLELQVKSIPDPREKGGEEAPVLENARDDGGEDGDGPG